MCTSSLLLFFGVGGKVDGLPRWKTTRAKLLLGRRARGSAHKSPHPDGAVALVYFRNSPCLAGGWPRGGRCLTELESQSNAIRYIVRHRPFSNRRLSRPPPVLPITIVPNCLSRTLIQPPPPINYCSKNQVNFDPTRLGLPPGWSLTSFSTLKG